MKYEKMSIRSIQRKKQRSLDSSLWIAYWVRVDAYKNIEPTGSTIGSRPLSSRLNKMENILSSR